MPPVSEAQRKAMWAAKEGRSTLGIPRAVGAEFVGKDADLKHAAGVIFVAPDGDVLLLQRSRNEANYAGHWGLPGGGAEDGETPDQAARRECGEEIGFNAEMPLKVVNRTKTPNDFLFTTFAAPVADKFAPKLNGEHVGYTWASLDMLPGPLHPSVASVLGEHIGAAQDMQPKDWDALRTGFAKWTREEEREPEHAADRALPGAERIAFDRAPEGESVRTMDGDGRLHVKVSNISKACVNPYLGREIPRAKELGLDADKIYRLFRDPEELSKAASSSNNVQLLFQHKPVNAKDPSKELVVGTTGTDGVFEYPYLRNSLCIWTEDAIKAVDSGRMKELSSAYRYDADMTPGTFEGQSYDGVMRNIRFNHVALVEEGRAGADVVVGDSANEEIKRMAGKSKIKLSGAGILAMGAMASLLAPRMAQDAAMPALAPFLKDVTAKNFKEQSPKFLAALKAALPGKLKTDFALDATMDDLSNMLDAFGGKKEGQDDLDPNAGMPMIGELDDQATDDDPMEKVKAMLLAAGVDPAIIAKIDEITGAAMADKGAAGDAEKDLPKVPGAADADKDADKDKEPKEEMVDKKAMDAAITAATDATAKRIRQEQRELREAERAVAPYVGELIGMDSAEQVYRGALKALNIKGHDTLHVSALRTVLEMQPLPGAKPAPRVIAQDGAKAKGFAERFPNANLIRHA